MGVHIGIRYTNRHVHRRAEGFYEELNPPMRSKFENDLQAALLCRPKPKVRYLDRLRNLFR